MVHYEERLVLPMTYLLAQGKGFEGILPSQAVLQKWLREDNSIHISVTRDWDVNTGYIWDGLDERNNEKKIVKNSQAITYEDYEDAMENALVECLHCLSNTTKIELPKQPAKLVSLVKPEEVGFGKFWDKAHCWMLRLIFGDCCLRLTDMHEPPLKSPSKIGYFYYIYIGGGMYLKTNKNFNL